MKLSLDLKTSLTQTLTPQQIQYLKLLQLPVIQLEQQVIQEIEQNPMLDSAETDIPSPDADFGSEDAPEFPQEYSDSPVPDSDYHDEATDFKSRIDEEQDPFEFYKMIWQEDSYSASKGKQGMGDDDDNEPFQIKAHVSFIEDLAEQLRLLSLPKELHFLGEQLLGNIDDDGYLRRDLQEIISETNELFAEINYEAQQSLNAVKNNGNGNGNGSEATDNPARQFAIDRNVLSMTGENYDYLETEGFEDEEVMVESSIEEKKIDFFKPITSAEAEKMLKVIQSLEPPGIGSRNMRECLLAQLYAIPKPNAAQKLAIEILRDAYEAFSMKHYHVIIKQLEVTEDYLKEALDYIRTLNPKPGGGDFQAEINTVLPDFVIEKEEDSDELLITVNDSRIPTLKLSPAYERIKRQSNYKMFNKETREWIRNKYEDAKFLIQAIRQRKITMLKVMTAIAALQRDFFDKGEQGLKPLIYKDVSEKTGLDISTVCRIVNGKYVQTSFGTYELKYFFSEALPNEDGEEISTTVIKNIIKEIIDQESKKKPLSDDKIAHDLKVKGYNVARRTVAKYREQLRIPVARLRKEL